MPKRRKRIEADITPRIAAWLLANYPHDCLVEIKIKGRLPKPHQWAALNDVKEGRFYYKFPDGRTRTPADIVVLRKAHALVVNYNPKTREATAMQVGTSNIFTFKP